MAKWKRDMILSISLIVISIILFVYSGTFKTDVINITAAMPDVYMRLWLGLLMILSLLLLVRTLREKPQDFLTPMWGKLQIFTVAALFFYIFLLDKLGFRVCTVLFVSIVSSVYSLSGMEERPKGKTLAVFLAKFLVLALVVTAASDVLFRTILSCNLPGFSLF